MSGQVNDAIREAMAVGVEYLGMAGFFIVCVVIVTLMARSIAENRGPGGGR